MCPFVCVHTHILYTCRGQRRGPQVLILVISLVWDIFLLFSAACSRLAGPKPSRASPAPMFSLTVGHWLYRAHYHVWLCLDPGDSNRDPHAFLASHFPPEHLASSSWNVSEQLMAQGSAVKSTGCASTGPEFYSQHLHGSSQPSVTPVLGNLVSSPDFCDIHT